MQPHFDYPADRHHYQPPAEAGRYGGSGCEGESGRRASACDDGGRGGGGEYGLQCHDCQYQGIYQAAEAEYGNGKCHEGKGTDDGDALKGCAD